jgi:hypothetical protein
MLYVRNVDNVVCLDGAVRPLPRPPQLLMVTASSHDLRTAARSHACILFVTDASGEERELEDVGVFFTLPIYLLKGQLCPCLINGRSEGDTNFMSLRRHFRSSPEPRCMKL